MIGGAVRPSSSIGASDSNLSSDFLAALATFREGGNEASRADNDQKTDVSEAVVNKAFLEKELESESYSESDSDV